MKLEEMLEVWFDSFDNFDEPMISYFIDALLSKESNSNFEWDDTRTFLKIINNRITEGFLETPTCLELKTTQDFDSIFRIIQRRWSIKNFFIIEGEEVCEEDLEYLDTKNYDQVPIEDLLMDWSDTRKNKYYDEIKEMSIDNMYPDGVDPDNYGIEYDD